jgi:hypothetical protein
MEFRDVTATLSSLKTQMCIACSRLPSHVTSPLRLQQFAQTGRRQAITVPAAANSREIFRLIVMPRHFAIGSPKALQQYERPGPLSRAASESSEHSQHTSAGSPTSCCSARKPYAHFPPRTRILTVPTRPSFRVLHTHTVVHGILRQKDGSLDQFVHHSRPHPSFYLILVLGSVLLVLFLTVHFGSSRIR